MYKLIWKYPLPSPCVLLSIPADAMVRHVGIDAETGSPALWVEQDQTAPSSERTFRVFATGEPIEPGCIFVGTTMMPTVAGTLVWHVFERLHPIDSRAAQEKGR